MKVFCVILFLLAALLPSSFAYDIEGTVRAASPFPKSEEVKIPEEHESHCGSAKISPKLKISQEGYLANAVIRLEGNFSDSGFPAVDKTYLLDQINCEFAPHVILIPQNANLLIKNSEKELHDVRAFNEKAQKLFYHAMPIKGQVLRKTFKEPGRVVVRCGIHKWMYAIVQVQEHPFYALTNEMGHFKLSDVPDGNYTLSVWHESLGELKMDVSPEHHRVDVVLKNPD